MSGRKNFNLLKLREALEASWDEKTANLGATEIGNSALGQCYPTARVVQYFFPETEIVIGVVWSGAEDEIHFWNCMEANGEFYHIDLSWQQFPSGSIVKEFYILDRNSLGDGPSTMKRCNLLKQRVMIYLKSQNLSS